MVRLDNRSRQLRRETIRLSKSHGGYHWGGAFSCVEILISLYDRVMKSEDRFVLSKGHGCWPYYVLLRERGLNPRLDGFPVRDPANGIHCTTGSLGHGLPFAIGMAMALKRQEVRTQVYVLVGDGECQEGTTWESLMIAARFRLDNLTAIVDWNGIQGSDRLLDVLPMEHLSRVAETLEWDVMSVNGHDTDAITAKLLRPRTRGRPRLVMARTIKGRGVSFMEDDPAWHAQWLTDEQERQAMRELVPVDLDDDLDDSSPPTGESA